MSSTALGLLKTEIKLLLNLKELKINGDIY